MVERSGRRDERREAGRNQVRMAGRPTGIDTNTSGTNISVAKLLIWAAVLGVLAHFYDDYRQGVLEEEIIERQLENDLKQKAIRTLEQTLSKRPYHQRESKSFSITIQGKIAKLESDFFGHGVEVVDADEEEQRRDGRKTYDIKNFWGPVSLTEDGDIMFIHTSNGASGKHRFCNSAAKPTHLIIDWNTDVCSIDFDMVMLEIGRRNDGRVSSVMLTPLVEEDRGVGKYGGAETFRQYQYRTSFKGEELTDLAKLIEKWGPRVGRGRKVEEEGQRIEVKPKKSKRKKTASKRSRRGKRKRANVAKKSASRDWRRDEVLLQPYTSKKNRRTGQIELFVSDSVDRIFKRAFSGRERCVLDDGTEVKPLKYRHWGIKSDRYFNGEFGGREFSEVVREMERRGCVN